VVSLDGNEQSTAPAGAGPRDATRGGVNVAACRDRGDGKVPSRSNIEFPKPKGGGGVQVNYPFNFHSSGGG
jgi:hypothetical protein